MLCPACSKANPANANYCYYDGRSLSHGGQQGPLQVGALPLPTPFYFPNGQSCANFNQLALACDARWDEAKALLADGAWQSYFSAIGRLDLAVAAKQAATEADLDLGLSQLLEKFPTDPNALRPPQLSLPTAEENLGTLTPGADRRFELMISNRGLLVLRGMATTNCEWLSLGDGAGSSLKMFQTRGIYSLPVRVLGNKLRAQAKPLQGDIVIDTNGGAITVPVRAEIPIRPFPGGKPANAALAGAKSPRQLAVKAKSNPLGAATLFEQGAVKAWYSSNGWTYPVQGTQASGKAAIQQFFEALGLTKPPRLEIDTQRLNCQGRAGQRLTEEVTISSPEPRAVYAQAWSNQPWIKAGPAKSQGNKATIPLLIEVPASRGQTLHADVTFQGNGQRQFVVPVTLAVSSAPAVAAGEEDDEPAGGVPWHWMLAGAALLLVLAVGAGAFVYYRGRANPANPTTAPVAANPDKDKSNPTPKDEPWWAGVKGANLAASVAALKEIAPQDQTVFDGIAAKDDVERSSAYEKLTADLPNLLGNPKAKEPLGRLLVECCVFDPSELCRTPLSQALTSQIPQDGAALQPDANGDELERGLWSLQTFFGAYTHPAVSPDNARGLAHALGRVFDALDEKAPPDQLKAQAEELLAQRCYRNIAPTAKKSIAHALTMRDSLIEKFPQYLDPAFREPVDLELLAEGLSKGNDAWPKLEPILKSCLESADPAVGKRIVDLYSKADAAAAKQMEASLAAKWPEVGDANSTRAEKVEAIQVRLTKEADSNRVLPQVRQAQLQKLVGDTLASVKADQKKESLLLRDTVRLAHASTMACALFHKDAGVDRVVRFDELVKQIPDVDQAEEKTPDKPDTTKPPVAKGKAVDGKIIIGTLTAKSDPDPLQPGSVCKEYLYALKAGQAYNISLQGGTFHTHLRLEDPKGASCGEADDNGVLGFIVRLQQTPSEDGDYRVVVSTPAPGKIGKYQFVVEKGFAFGAGPLFGPRFGPLFGPVVIPGPAPVPAAPKTDEKKEKQPLSLRDLAKLDSKIGAERGTALENIAGSVLDDMTPPQAQKIAKYLLVTDQAEDELEKVKAQLESFHECSPLLLALADVIGDENTALAQKRTEAVVGGVLTNPAGFAGDPEWRSACRTMLVQCALDLTRSARTGADQAADILRDLYKEQGKALGIEAPGFFGLTRPTQVLEAVIKHVAAKAAQQNPAAEDKDDLEQIDRHLQAARFVAANDLEYMVLLQRLWIKVLVIYLQEKAPAQVKAMARIQQDLGDQDRRSSGALDQLRAGEEKALRLWALADNLK